MRKLLENPIIPVILLAILSFYLFFFQLGGFGLTDPDETFYAQTAKEMLKRGEWSTPYLYGKPQFEKPILFYWLVELSFKIFGVNEYAARFPSAVFGLLGLAAVYLLGGMFFNKRVGVLSALILATNVEYIMLSRACVTDMALSTFMLSGFLLFFYGYLKEKGHFCVLSSAAFGLATLTKGPIGVLLPAVIIFSYLVIVRDIKAIRRIPVAWCVIVFFAVSLPWYLLMHRLHGGDFIDAFFGFHNVARFLESEHVIGSQFYYNIPIVLGGFFPWSAFLPFGLWRTFKKVVTKNSREREGAIFILLWFAVIFIFFSISSTKLPTYIFPFFPSLAFMVALIWDEFLSKGVSISTMKAMKRSYYLLLAVIFISAAGLYAFIRLRYPSMLLGAGISGLSLLFGIALSTKAFKAKRFHLFFFFIVFSVILFLYPFSKLVLPELERYETSREISEKLLSMIDEDDYIGSEKDYRIGLIFYTGRAVADLDRHHYLVRFLNLEKRVWCVLKEKNHIQLYDPSINHKYVKPTYMIYKLGKKCIVTNTVPPDGKYLVRREMTEYEDR